MRIVAPFEAVFYHLGLIGPRPESKGYEVFVSLREQQHRSEAGLQEARALRQLQRPGLAGMDAFSLLLLRS